MSKADFTIWGKCNYQKEIRQESQASKAPKKGKSSKPKRKGRSFYPIVITKNNINRAVLRFKKTHVVLNCLAIQKREIFLS